MLKLKSKFLRRDRLRAKSDFHPMGCGCSQCAPNIKDGGRGTLALKAAARLLFLSAALIAIPFIVARSFAAFQSEWR